MEKDIDKFLAILKDHTPRSKSWDQLAEDPEIRVEKDNVTRVSLSGIEVDFLFDTTTGKLKYIYNYKQCSCMPSG